MALKAPPTDLAPEDRLTKRWYPLYPHPVQIAMRDCPARFQVNPAGRRSGKTERKKRKLVKACLDVRNFKFDDPMYVAAAPTFSQAKSIWWKDLKAMVPKWAVRGRPSESELRIDFITGATLRVIGMDKPERIEGSPLDGIVLDEFANMKASAWEENILPALADRRGWADLIGVPEGRNHYYDLWKQSIGAWSLENGGNWAGFTWHSADVISEDEIAFYKSIMDELTFRQEFEADFINFVGQAYYNFIETSHASSLFQNYNPKAPLLLMFDFNVDPGVCAIGQEMSLPTASVDVPGVKVGETVLFGDRVVNTRAVTGTGIIGEVHIPKNSNTPAVCKKIVLDWGAHEGHIFVYGDATGGSRGTAQTEGSDWDLVKNTLYDHYGSQRVHMRVPAGNPTERSRINAMNSRLKAQDGSIKLMVDPSKAPMVVKDLEGVRLLEGGSGEIDKKHDPLLTHLSDAVGYYIVKEYPVRGEKSFTRTLPR